MNQKTAVARTVNPTAPATQAAYSETAEYPPLARVTSPTVPTAQAAYYLNRRSQTLRIWAMGKCDAPIRPLRVFGRLAWPVADLRRLLGVA